MTDYKLVKTPIVTNSVYKSIKRNMKVDKNEKKFPYKEALGSLAYLVNSTKPDLAYAINWMSRRQSNPSFKDLVLVKRIF